MPLQRLQAVTAIPPLPFQDYPVNIHIRIYREGARYGADILAVGRSQRVPIEMSPQDLVALNKQLQEAVEAIACADDVEGEKPTAEELEEQLRPLAEVGHFAFKRVFGHPLAMTVVMELLGDWPSSDRCIKSNTGQSSMVAIQIASEDFFLPWELLYPVGLDEPLSCEHLWGMNYVISRIIVQEARPGAFVSPVIPVLVQPKLGLLTYRGLEHVLKREIPFFEKLHDNGKIALFKLRPLDPEKKREELKEFKGFWDRALNLAHFACHAFYDDEAPDLSRILLSDEFPISLRDMEVYSIQINGHPLIMMNACETGNLNPLYTSYFAAAFLKYGARGVVTTECAVPDAFAADFAEQLYTHLLAGEELGESLLATRRYFLEKYHNPSGLLYSMYAPPSIRLQHMGGKP